MQAFNQQLMEASLEAQLRLDAERTILYYILSAIEKEVERASRKHGPHHSAHESYGVLCEEVQEFFDEVRKQQVDKFAMRTELVQIAAVCVRAIRDLNL